jgi:predicted ribosomally synthesized peptide with nif11-like leader
MSLHSAKELLTRLARDRAFRRQLKTLPDKEARRQWLRAQGFEITLDEVNKVAAARSRPRDQLTDQELDAVVGGTHVPAPAGDGMYQRAIESSQWALDNGGANAAYMAGLTGEGKSVAAAAALTAAGDQLMPGGETARTALNEYEHGQSFSADNVYAVDADLAEKAADVKDRLATATKYMENIDDHGMFPAAVRGWHIMRGEEKAANTEAKIKPEKEDGELPSKLSEEQCEAGNLRLEGEGSLQHKEEIHNLENDVESPEFKSDVLEKTDTVRDDLQEDESDVVDTHDTSVDDDHGLFGEGDDGVGDDPEADFEAMDLFLDIFM